MNGLIEIVNAGLGNSIQDTGRFGYRHMGITVSGCLDIVLARCANALVGNAAGAACIEIRLLGPTLQVRQGPVRVAVAGNMVPKVRRADGRQEESPAWTSVMLETGDVLETGTVRGGVAYVAVSGGIDTPLQLGSRSTYQRALIGGIDGRLLVNGNLLPCGVLAERNAGERTAPSWTYADEAVRVMPGPQQGHFKPESVHDFFATEYKVTPQMDRMGMRLEGKALEHLTPASADIVSDGVTPGVIQVPGNGQPIILLADCQTVGGYPKIATVISADLPHLAQLKPGQTIRFRAVDAVEARAALVERGARWRAWAESVRTVPTPMSPDSDDDEDCWVAV